MRMIECPNCGKMTGFKRSLGFGTFFAVLFTCGAWFLAIPFYPLRCMNCGMKEASAKKIAWYVPNGLGARIAIAVIVGFVVIVLYQLVVHFVF